MSLSFFDVRFGKKKSVLRRNFAVGLLFKFPTISFPTTKVVSSSYYDVWVHFGQKTITAAKFQCLSIMWLGGWLSIYGCTCRVVVAGHQSVDANSIVTSPHTLLTYIQKYWNQSPWSHSTSLLLTLACSLVEVTATRRWVEATALQLHLTAHLCRVLCNQKELGFHCIYPKRLNLL